MRKVKVGVIGACVISDIYPNNFTQIFQNISEVKTAADIVHELAEKQARAYNFLSSEGKRETV